MLTEIDRENPYMTTQVKVEIVDSYVYLGHTLTRGRENQTVGINRRKRA